MKVWDDGQNCCEHRYMMTGDDLTMFSGDKILDIEVRDAPDMEDEWGNCHEVQFLEIRTNRGYFTMTTHNGYYGGFYVRIEEE